MAVFLCWTPTRFVVKHEEYVALFLCVDIVQLLVQIAELQETRGHEVIFDALILEVSVHSLDEFEITEIETNQLVRGLILVKRHHKRPIKSIVAKKLQFLSVVVSSEGLFRAFHV